MADRSDTIDSTGKGEVLPAGPSTTRVGSIDLVRGIVMVLMVLDHVRDFFGNAGVDPTNLSTTTPALFFTRWVTHFCAPTFVFLSGISASLSGERRSRGELSRHLATRGLWLIVLEQTWGNVFIFFTYPQFVLALILWAIGWSMIALAGLIYLPRIVIGAVGLTMIACHNWYDGVQAGEGITGLYWAILHVPGFRTLPGGIPILIGYPLIPWVGVMALGYALGPLFSTPSGRRRPILFAMGLGSLVAFIALRWVNRYGNPFPWAVQTDFLRSAMSFLNCQKYPPSLLFLLMTLGVTLLALGLFDRVEARPGSPLMTIGRAPLFFYLLQWPVAHGLAVFVEAIQGHPIGWMFRFPPELPSGYGESLPRVYLFWIVTLALLYYPTRWYANRPRRLRGVS